MVLSTTSVCINLVRTYCIGAVRAGTAAVVLLLLTPHFNYPIHDLASNPPAHLFVNICARADRVSAVCVGATAAVVPLISQNICLHVFCPHISYWCSPCWHCCRGASPADSSFQLPNTRSCHKSPSTSVCIYFVHTYCVGAVRAGTAAVVLLLLTPHFNYPIHDLATNPPAHLFVNILCTRRTC